MVNGNFCAGGRRVSGDDSDCGDGGDSVNGDYKVS